MLPIAGRSISQVADDTLSTNFRSSLCMRPSLPTLWFWQSPMATVARATGKTAYDMHKAATVAMLPTEWCSLKPWRKRIRAGHAGSEFRREYLR